MKKKSRKKIIIVTIISLMVLGIGGGVGFAYLKTSDKMMDYVLTDLLEAEVAKGLGEVIGDEVVISDPKILENLGLVVSSLGGEVSTIVDTHDSTENSVAVSGENPAKEGFAKEQEESSESNAEGQDKTAQRSEPIKVSKKELQQAIEKKVDTITSQVPVSDKANMTNLILKYIDKSEINYLTSLVLDGVSQEDIAIAKKIAKESFPEEAMEDVYNYYKKYAGLVANK